MPRTRTGRTSNTTPRRRTNGGVTSIAPYHRDPRWATPTRPRNDVFVVDIADRTVGTPDASDDDSLLLTA